MPAESTEVTGRVEEFLSKRKAIILLLLGASLCITAAIWLMPSKDE